jgi:hypothetical protein
MFKNAYVLGIGIALSETISSFLFGGGFPVVGIVAALAAGSFWTKWYSTLMPAKERLRVIGVYMLLAVFSLYTTLAPLIDGRFPLSFVIFLIGLFFIVYGALLYVLLGSGSKAMLRPTKLVTEKKPAPTDTTFNLEETKPQYSKTSLLGALAMVIAAMFWLLILSSDPLSYYMAGISGIFFLLLYAFFGWTLWNYFASKRTLAVLITIITGLVLYFGTQLLIASYSPPSPDAEPNMIANQQAAIECLKNGKNLQVRFVSKRKLRKGARQENMPLTSSPMCGGEFRWEKEPWGWTYMPVLDKDVSDGTFTFAMMNRSRDFIICTEAGCVRKNVDGSAEVLHETPVVSQVMVTVTPFESQTIGLDDEIKLFEMHVVNTSDVEISLERLLFEEIGSIEDGIMRLLYIKEGERKYELSFSGLRSSATDGVMFFYNDEMLRLKPGQKRTYEISADLKPGKTIPESEFFGLRLLGFSNDRAIKGFPVDSNIHTIEPR